MAFCKFTLTRVAVVAAMAYIAYNMLTFYTIFFPPQCPPNDLQRCILPAHTKDKKLELWVFTSTKLTQGRDAQSLDLIFRKKDLLRDSVVKASVNISLPRSTRNNGSLYVHVYLGPKGKSPLRHSDIQDLSVVVAPLTRYTVPQSTVYSLLAGTDQANSSVDDRPVTHWIPWLTIHSLAEDFNFDRMLLTEDLVRVIRVVPNSMPLQYLPILYVDRLKVSKKHLEPLPSNGTVALEINYSPVRIGVLRLWLIFEKALESMKELGFTEKEFDDVKGIFLDTSVWLFGLTIFISIFHLLFDFLAFKNDISFWRHRRTMVGLSSRVIIWRCFSQTVVFLYLLDEKTSLLVLIPSGIATIIEYWKITKVLKIRVKWVGILPSIEREKKLEAEEQTESYDSEAMKKLSYVLIPLVLIGAVYQLLFSTYKSWYSWLIHSLVNGVYAFGFLFMLPQLFLNYKLKSVAHLPWRAFMYKAFNTFIDDVFAFIITMPTSHRIAVFRDDLVFLVYLYQRWLYPVDRTRVNEYGESFDEKEKTKEHKD